MIRQLLGTYMVATGLLLLLTGITAAQGPDTAVRYGSRQKSLDGSYVASVVQLGAEITSTTTFTTFLPIVVRGFPGCTSAPTLLNPVNGIHLDTLIPLFRLDVGNDPFATEWQVLIAKDAAFSNTVASFWGSTTSGIQERRRTRNFAPSTTYFWRAWLHCGARYGPDSEVWSFTTGSDGSILSAPALITPTHGSVIPADSVTLQWAPVSGAAGYIASIGIQGGWLFTSSWTTQTEATFPIHRNAGYEWWIAAYNDYAVGADSPIWYFSTPSHASAVEFSSSHYYRNIEDHGRMLEIETRINQHPD